MDGIKSRVSVVVIGATNRPDALDPSLRRPPWFDREIYFPLPSFLDRTAILSLLTKNWQMPPRHEAISLLASKTIGFAGADLQALCAHAAINSLKRRVSVDQLMSLVEKQISVPTFSNLRVNTVDWATALQQVSPPCSWRSAKAALNSVICAPVPHHILPVLLWPMAELLVSLHLDSRAVLPPVLNKLATILEVTLKEYLGHSWIDQTSTFLHGARSSSLRKELERRIEEIFMTVGMVCDGNARPATLTVPDVAYQGSKFRVMMSTKERAWVDHFAAWFMFGFEGFAEMCNLNLTTMLQEGGGDVVQGLIHILGSIQNKSPCVVYMPQMESWAVEFLTTDQEQAEKERQASHYWNIFVQQVNLLPSSLEIIFVASSQMCKDDVPQEVVDFFWGTSVSSFCSSNVNSPGQSLLQESWLSFNRSFPCSWVEAFPVHDMKKVFSRAADGFAGLFWQELLCHGQSAYETSTTEPPNSAKRVLSAEVLEASSLSKGFQLDITEHAMNKDFVALSPVTGFNEIGSIEATSACSRGNEPSSLCSPDQSYLPIAISMVGYQLLYHPELRDLRRATSKLHEGPSYTTVMSKTTLPELANSSSVQSDHANTLSWKGLNAVGLLAYSGNYLKAREVAAGVQEVMELLMKRINMKVKLGKDRTHFSHLCRKGASLQDEVFMWAYNLRRFDFVLSRPEGNTPVFPKSKAGRDKDTLQSRIFSATEEREQRTTLVPFSSEMINSIEALRGVKMDGQVPRTSFSCDKTDRQFQLSPAHTENSEKKLHFNYITIKDKVNEVVAHQQLPGNTAMMKCCPSCLNLVKGALKKLFIRAWNSRGSELSLSVADEVIGRCVSAVSLELHRVWDSDSYSTNLSCRIGRCCSHHTSGQATKSELLTSVESGENLMTSSHVCHCWLVKLISELKY